MDDLLTSRAAEERLAAAADLDAVASIERELLGRRSLFNDAKRQISGLDPGERAAAGRCLNDARARVETAVAAARERLAASGRADRYQRNPASLTGATESHILRIAGPGRPVA